jgi:DNA-binding MarR family transcriptional regulator|uniref:MarR family winged helix-turn-helix transcriptional regulator n=1 Tax=Altererythrobacter segetis TaxID=1104773 RepID=UPI00140D6D22|nr:MarR family transcriptional regulator [Altererythrobacter segetis]
MSEAKMATKSEAGTLYGLVSMRMIRLFVMLRKSGILAQRRQFGLSETEWRIMTQLGEAAPLSLNGLADAMLQDRGQLSRAVKSMVERDLLTRERKPGGPEIEIDLSDEGRAIYRRMVEWVHERDRALTTGIPPEDVAVVWQVLTAMMERAQGMLDEEQRLGG